VPAVEFVTKVELASRLDVEPRTITNWIRQHHDFPSRVSGRSREFPWLRCLQWFLQRESARAAPPAAATEAASRARKMAAEAEIAELNLAERRGALIPLSVHEQRCEDLASRLFAAATGQLIPLIRAEFHDVDVLTLQAAAERISDGVIAACRSSADDIDEAADAAEVEEGEDGDADG
jgi:hypothetical protein